MNEYTCDILFRKCYNLIKIYRQEAVGDYVTDNIADDLLAELDMAMNELENEKSMEEEE